MEEDLLAQELLPFEHAQQAPHKLLKPAQLAVPGAWHVPATRTRAACHEPMMLEHRTMVWVARIYGRGCTSAACLTAAEAPARAWPPRAQVFAQTVRDKGAAGLFTGMGPRVTQTALMSAVFFSLFEFWKAQLKR